MNTSPENDTATIRSNIDQTRRRMDDTMDALGDRFQGRHLFDELLGFFRRQPERGREIGETISRSANSAVHAVADTIKSNPVPALLIGAGVAWLVYERTRKASDDDREMGDYAEPASGSAARQDWTDTDTLYDRPLDYPSSATTPTRGSDRGYNAGGPADQDVGPGAGSESKFADVKDRVVEKASHAKDQMKQKLSDVGSRVRERTHAIGEQAREFGSHVQQRARDTYERGRERVVTTANEHPLELGLACLAAGVIAGLALPTPERVNRIAGPSMDRLRDRTRKAGSELLEKGQRVASAAADAAKHEAENQGLTPESLRTETAAGTQAGENQSGAAGSTSGQPQSDPLASRPVM